VSTPQDLDRFYRALLTGRLLRPAQLAEMQKTVPTDPAKPDESGYGLGIAWLQLPCGRSWGHTGGVIGQATFSFHSGDGRRQFTSAENMTFYALPDQVTPIDTARGQFIVAALCGPQPAPAAQAAPGAEALSRLPSQTADVTLAR
jgi:D-alanyl-D-alanine carboxypeptidase